ncbi:MAG TPA: SRPBCC family protein [Thermoanaerobaculia bacterium]|nr:SRPBCC family protein [Thermoanaerobaculia bacterium]
MREVPTRSHDQGTEESPRHEAPGQPKGLAALLGGAALVAYAVYKGASRGREAAHTAASPAPRHETLPTHIEANVNVLRPAQELYSFWRNFENLPGFMRHLESVSETGNGRSHWIAKTLVGSRVEWDAEVVDEREGQLISWRSLPGSQVHNTGSVLFESLPGDRGTMVRATFDLAPPGGAAGRLAAKALGPITKQQVHEDLRRFKNLMEAGEIPTTEGQPEGRRPLVNPRNPL